MTNENSEEKTQETEENDECCKFWKEKKFHKHHHGGGCGGQSAIYGIGVIGALFYFLQNVTGFVPILLGIGKAIFWPAFVVFKLLTILKI